MAVQTNITVNKETYSGCVLDLWERNGSWDSDFYAVCWNKEKQQVVNVMYDTTRCGGGGHAEIDATEEVLREVYRHYKKMAADYFDKTYNEKLARMVRKGDTVEVVRGRKIPKGTAGKVFWTGTKYNPYSHEDENRVGIEMADGSRFFVRLDYVSVIGWQERLIHGKKRRQMIRNNAINSMPAHYRHLFIEGLAQ